jgi:hypothetical protein
MNQTATENENEPATMNMNQTATENEANLQTATENEPNCY